MTDDIENKIATSLKHNSMVILRREIKKNKDNLKCVRLTNSWKTKHSKTEMK